MITIDKEFFLSPYYFFLRDKGKEYQLYFSVEETLTEARKKDVMMKIPKEKVDVIKKYLERVSKSKKKKGKENIKGEIEELVNLDGAFSNSKIPILDPRLHPKKTMDQTVAAARITNDPIARGYRTYYGESVEDVNETDMSGVFGYAETSGMTGPETYKYFVEKLDLEPSDAEERVRQQGKNPFKEKKPKKGADLKLTISEIQKQKMIKVVEDMLAKKKNSGDADISTKEKEISVSNIVKKNLKTLLKQIDKEGLSKKDLIKLINGE